MLLIVVIHINNPTVAALYFVAYNNHTVVFYVLKQYHSPYTFPPLYGS